MRGKCILFKEKINYKPPGCRADKVHQDLKETGINIQRSIYRCLFQ